MKSKKDKKAAKATKKIVHKDVSKIFEKAHKESTILQKTIKENIPQPVLEKKPEVPKQVDIEKKRLDEEFVDAKNKVEALLFACGKYVQEDIISELCEIDKRKLKKVLEELKKDYESRNNALMIFQEENSWKINVREKYVSLVRKIVADTELSRSIMETLAVIAWKSPIFQSEVVRIRGNKCYDHIEELENAGFITKEKKGRSYVLKTTDKFYNYFDIDQGNLKGIFDTVKIPELKQEEQQTLDEIEKMPETPAQKIETINVLKRVETDEEKEGHRVFLETIEQRIVQVSEKNTQLEQEIPKPVLQDHGNIQPPFNNQEDNDENILEIKEEIIIVEKPEEKKDTETVNIPETVQEKPKHKSLTKKQLEKKFKDELLRVREKMEKTRS